MKSIYMTMAAVSALAVAAPAAAQPAGGMRGMTAAQSWNGDRLNVVQLQTRLGAGIGRGTITRTEAVPLRDSLRELIRMERHLGRDGFNSQERNSLQRRSASLQRHIERADSNGNGRDRGAGGHHGRDHDGRDSADTDRRDTRGDRFAGDVRVGQRFSARMIAVPAQYRERYKDSDSSYYRYDDDRIYQIDRTTGLILAMFSIAG